LYASEEKLTEKILKEEDPEAYKSLIRWKRIIKELHEDDKRNVRPSNKRRAKPCFGLGCTKRELTKDRVWLSVLKCLLQGRSHLMEVLIGWCWVLVWHY